MVKDCGKGELNCSENPVNVSDNIWKYLVAICYSKLAIAWKSKSIKTITK